MNAIRQWAANNRPTVAALTVALTPTLQAILSGDITALIDSWPGVAELLAPIVLAVLFGQIAQGGGDIPLLGAALAERAQRKGIGTVPYSELLEDGPDTPEEAAIVFGVDQ